ncbi:MAG TPA: SIS domain-containing protein [Anaerolineales bacterium]|nr:SIS domain-containing protein [Anaerolineales bacterium]HMX73356.1 SIS domain-containing protein [Anaerolineales bacterium]HMZ42413.1 SIS domain-containing protein [Anaerolineales bacterium]HNA53800.1 SIS domain-containing protein [Anaerolineales bacterium]HNB85842.1 SIS domain-containing protein [Anaerolineales bacterium]
MTLFSEINEQPERIKALLASQRKNVERIAAEIKKRDIEYVFLAARGTSDNAGRYANYLLGAMNGLPLALATPSLFTYYKRPPKLKNALVIGVSQSGKSPDIVSVLEEGRKQGCQTLSITNEPDSPLAQASDFVLDIHAGAEKAVAATKTYTTELMSVAMLSAALSGNKAQWNDLSKVAAWMRQSLKQNDFLAQAAQRYRYIDQTVVLGRGFNYATAFEWALKLKELTYIIAEPYSSADFAHGPIAMVESGYPVFAVAPKGKVFNSMLEMLNRLRSDIAAELIVISNDKRALALAQVPLSIPVDVPEWLSPLVNILPAQLFAYHLTVAKGYNTEQPRSIRKVTETK